MKPLLKILLIGDNSIKAFISKHKIDETNSNLDIIEAHSVATAISLYKNQHFDGVLLKFPLVDENAVVTIEQLSRLKSTVPIIVLSAQNDEKKAVEIMKAGAYDYLSDSRITPEIIERTIRQGLRVYQTEIAIQQINRRLRTRNKLLRKKNKELKIQRQKIKLQNLQLQQAYELKSQFLSTLSHELRTPMNSIIGFSQILLKNYPDPLTPHQTDIVERIYSNCQNLLTMINEVLDFSELETGKMNFKADKFDLGDLIRVIVEETRSLAVQKNLTLDIELSLNNPMVTNDRFCCRGIIVNLISNALKFTGNGGVLVKAWELDSNRLAIAVQDTGIGISADSLATIFEAFRQVDQSNSRRYQGTGLGLAIVNSLVKMIGGKITVESELNQGSIFQVEIPRNMPMKSTS